MDARSYLAILRKWWLLVVALTIIGGAVAYAYASTLPALYKSSASLLVGSTQGETTSELLQGANYSQNLVQSYAAMATMSSVLTRAIDDLDTDVTVRQLAAKVSAEAPLNTVIIEVSATDSDPEQAARIANAVARALASTVESISPKNADGQATVQLETVAVADAPTGAISPNTRLIVLSGAAVGLVLALIFAFAREMLDTRVRDEGELERVTGLPITGEIPRSRDKTASPVALSATGPDSEAFRRLWTNLQFADVDRGVRSVLVTSAVAGEGKTTTASKLAAAAAERLDRVLLVDADLRRPMVAVRQHLEGSVGLTTVLRGGAQLEDVIVPGGVGRPDILVSGATPPNPGQVLNSDAMSSLVNTLREDYDLIVFDAPPVLPVTDTLSLAGLVDGILLVTRFNFTRREQVLKTLASLASVKARMFGIVLNEVNRSRKDASYYDYSERTVEPKPWWQRGRRRDDDESALDVPDVAAVPEVSDVAAAAPDVAEVTAPADAPEVTAAADAPEVAVAAHAPEHRHVADHPSDGARLPIPEDETPEADVEVGVEPVAPEESEDSEEGVERPRDVVMSSATSGDHGVVAKPRKPRKR